MQILRQFNLSIAIVIPMRTFWSGATKPHSKNVRVLTEPTTARYKAWVIHVPAFHGHDGPNPKKFPPPPTPSTALQIFQIPHSLYRLYSPQLPSATYLNINIKRSAENPAIARWFPLIRSNPDRVLAAQTAQRHQAG